MKKPTLAAMLFVTALGGCQLSGAAGVGQAAGQIEQQLPGYLTATETIAVNTLILRYQELQRLKMVLDGFPVPQLPPLPPSPPNPPTQPPVVTPTPPPPVPPPAPVPVPQGLRSHAKREIERRPDFWVEHHPSFRLVATSRGITAETSK